MPGSCWDLSFSRIRVSLTDSGAVIELSRGRIMSSSLDGKEIAARLALTILAGTLIGINRGEHGRPAGLRTTLLVCLAASLAMIQTNLLLGTGGRSTNSFVMLDLMRLPLGILSGMGFIGGGVILKRDDLILGVTTAATLWFVTVLGLCFGGGQLILGSVGLGLGLVVLWGLKWAEMALPQDHRASLMATLGPDAPSVRRVLPTSPNGRVRDRFTRPEPGIRNWAARGLLRFEVEGTSLRDCRASSR